VFVSFRTTIGGRQRHSLDRTALASNRGPVANVDPPEVTDRFHAELSLVHALASRLTKELGGSVETQELVSYGMEGLLGAARRFTPIHGVPFRKFAYHRVRGAMIDGVRTNSTLPRAIHRKARALHTANLVASGFFADSTPTGTARLSSSEADDRIAKQLAVLATAMAIGFQGREAVVGEERVLVTDDPPEATAERDELMRIVKTLLPALSDQERAMVRRHFFRDESVDEIAASLGISRSWGSRVLAKAIGKLSKQMQHAV